MRRTKERYSYIVLTILSIMVAISSVFISLQQVRSTNHRFCDLVIISDQYPVVRPADSTSDKVKHRAYAMYNAYDKFGKSLGCHQKSIIAGKP